MTESKPLTPMQENDALAAELALGLLAGDEEQAAIARLAQDAGFAKSVWEWQERLAGIADSITPVMPPARAWHGIREKLGHVQAILIEDPATRLRPWWRGPFGALAGFAVIAAIALGLWLPLTEPNPPGNSTGQYQAQLVSEDQTVKAEAYLRDREIKITLERGGTPDGRGLQAWWLAPGAADPVLLGKVSADGPLSVALRDDLAPEEGVKIALSEAPESGTSTGQVIGKIVAIADLTGL